MLSASPAIPLSSIEFDQGNGRRLSLTTAHGRQFFTHRDGLPSPEQLTPIGGTPAGSGAGTPLGSNSDSDPNSRRASDNNLNEHYEDGGTLYKANSRGGIWHDDVSTTVPASHRDWFVIVLLDSWLDDGEDMCACRVLWRVPHIYKNADCAVWARSPSSRPGWLTDDV